MAYHIIRIAIVAVNDRHTLVNRGTALFLAPYAVAAETGAYGRHVEGHTLEWRIAPWLVVTWENGQVQTYQ